MVFCRSSAILCEGLKIEEVISTSSIWGWISSDVTWTKNNFISEILHKTRTEHLAAACSGCGQWTHCRRRTESIAKRETTLKETTSVGALYSFDTSNIL